MGKLFDKIGITFKKLIACIVCLGHTFFAGFKEFRCTQKKFQHELK